MPSWLVKSAIHRFISLLPNSQKFNELFQERVTKSLGLTAGAFEFRLNYCRRYFEDFIAVRPECAEGFTALELGTGWYPIIPIGLYLCGATEIWSFDIVSLLKRERLKILLNYFCEYDRAGTLKNFLPALRADRMARLHEAARLVDTESPEIVLEKINLHAIVRDAQDTGLPAKSVDLFFSCVVLEHIPAFVQRKLNAEFLRLASPRGVLIEFVDLKDQYAAFDKSLTVFNFLKFSDSAWAWLNSPLIPQWRLRVSDLRALLRESGWEIVKEVNNVASASDLEKVKLAPKFQNYSREDLLAVETWLVAKPA
ncbi:MAG TPA: methyltransferase domain-containing protein [Verrucomicrobiae bacterium]|nr:methyltransferase domain-containing protein [Verrucomicrobiae bacterium]